MSQPWLQTDIFSHSKAIVPTAARKKKFLSAYYSQIFELVNIKNFNNTICCRLKIRDLLPSPALAELLELRLPAASEEDESAGQPGNWFGLSSVMRLITQFQSLDTNKNGFLSQAEFSGYAAL